MRRFLRTVGLGGGQAAPAQHFAVDLNGGPLLTNADSDKRFYYFGAAPFVAVSGVWVMLHSKADYQEVFRLGDGSSAAADCLGLHYNPTSDHFEAFKSDGVGYSFGGATFSPALDTWYFLGVSWGPNAVTIDAYTLSGLINTFITGVTPTYNTPANAIPLQVGGAGGLSFNGRLDSLMYGFTGDNSASPSGLMWNNGKALDWGESAAVQASIAAKAGSIRLWVDFNEPDNAASYADSADYSGTPAPLTRIGSGTTRVKGAGF